MNADAETHRKATVATEQPHAISRRHLTVPAYDGCPRTLATGICPRHQDVGVMLVTTTAQHLHKSKRQHLNPIQLQSDIPYFQPCV